MRGRGLGIMGSLGGDVRRVVAPAIFTTVEISQHMD